MTSSPRTPSWLKALGRAAPPETIELAGGTYRLDRVLKHDFFAFTARYEGERERVILKIGRKAGFFGLPLGWIGRLHAWHESAVFEALQDLETVPLFTGRYGRHGLTHLYIEGHDLKKGEQVPDDFFPRLRADLKEIHRRGMAYVDLEKCENVLVGDDGRPYLFDFQISWRTPGFGGERWPLSRIRSILQTGDLYHLAKLQRRTRPDQMSDTEITDSRRRPFFVRLHTLLTRPLTKLRRRVLNKIDPVKKRGERGRVPRTDHE